MMRIQLWWMMMPWGMGAQHGVAVWSGPIQPHPPKQIHHQHISKSRMNLCWVSCLKITYLFFVANNTAPFFIKAWHSSWQPNAILCFLDSVVNTLIVVMFLQFPADVVDQKNITMERNRFQYGIDLWHTTLNHILCNQILSFKSPTMVMVHVDFLSLIWIDGIPMRMQKVNWWTLTAFGICFMQIRTIHYKHFWEDLSGQNLCADEIICILSNCVESACHQTASRGKRSCL